jgi:hypothetical protein
MPMLRSTGATTNVFAICGSAVAITVPSSCSMNNAPATRSAMTELCRAENSMEKKLSAQRLFRAAASETAQDGEEVNRQGPWGAGQFEFLLRLKESTNVHDA